MTSSRTSRERRLWIAVGAAIVALLVSLYPLQFLLDFLRARNLLRLSITLLFLLSATAIVGWLARRGATVRQWLVLALSGVVYAAFALWLDVPQERLHLVEYGALALLLRAAFAERRAARDASPDESRTSGKALLAASFVGLVDEIVQGILPNRQYDLRDVGFNALSAALALGTVAAITWAGGGGRRSAK